MQQHLYKHYCKILKMQKSPKTLLKASGEDELINNICSSVLQELSGAFDSEAKDTRKSRLQLTANVAGLRSIVDKAYEVEKIVP